MTLHLFALVSAGAGGRWCCRDGEQRQSDQYEANGIVMHVTLLLFRLATSRGRFRLGRMCPGTPCAAALLMARRRPCPWLTGGHSFAPSSVFRSRIDVWTRVAAPDQRRIPQLVSW